MSDPEAIYALYTGLLISDREFDFSEVLSFELGYYPPAHFDANGEMRLPTAKSDLKKILGMTINIRTFGTPTHIIIDVSAYLWTLKWPSKGKFSLVIDEVKKSLRELLTKSDVHWINDRYFDYSPKSASRLNREAGIASRLHELRLDMPIIDKKYVLRCVENKKKLNKLIYDCITNDEEFLKEATRHHKLIIMNENTVPYQFHDGRKVPRMDLASSHEEADNIITKHAILCGLESGSKTKVLSDDTDIFALLSYFYQLKSLNHPMIM